jgi:sugar lactone lactonase YvrE
MLTHVADRRIRTLIDGLYFGEGPRWHDGALWFSDMHDHRVLRVTVDGAGAADVVEVARVEHDQPSGLGFLPDGRLLMVAMKSAKVLRVEVDGAIRDHAELSSLARGMVNDMIVTDDGTAYVGDMGDLEGGNAGPGQILRVTPDGAVMPVADDLAAPNGPILTDDGRTFIVAESSASRITAFDVLDDGGLGKRRVYAPLEREPDARTAAPDGICLDADGAVWVAEVIGGRLIRVLEGGEVTDTIRFDGAIPIACVLGGHDRRTLFVCVAAGFRPDVIMQSRTGRIDVCTVDVPGAGKP